MISNISPDLGKLNLLCFISRIRVVYFDINRSIQIHEKCVVYDLAEKNQSGAKYLQLRSKVYIGIQLFYLLIRVISSNLNLKSSCEHFRRSLILSWLAKIATQKDLMNEDLSEFFRTGTD